MSFWKSTHNEHDSVLSEVKNKQINKNNDFYNIINKTLASPYYWLVQIVKAVFVNSRRLYWRITWVVLHLSKAAVWLASSREQ